VKVLLLPLAGLAFLAFLLILGAIGLGIAFLVLAVLNRIWRLLNRGARPRQT
jgi:hypothetical protein